MQDASNPTVAYLTACPQVRRPFNSH
jgi:hypothetical protein